MNSIQNITFCLSIFLFSLAIFSSPNGASARTFYVDENASSSAKQDGGVDTPWKTVQSALQKGAVSAGDTIIFRNGTYGKISIKNRRNSEPVTIKAQNGHNAEFSSIRISSSSNWIIEGLKINGSSDGEYKKRKLVTVGGDSDKITLNNLSIESISDASHWTANDWATKASDGIRSSGKNVVIRNNKIRNVANGITALGERTLIAGNTVEEFSADGMRALASNLVFEDNLVKNCIDVDKNHDDGFQSWSYGPNGKPGRGTISNVILRRNTFIGSDRPDKKFTCDMQGIGMFDGMYENWVIENNLVVVDHWHGITVMGAKNVRIINNTVYDPNNLRPGPANIKILPHKNKTPSTDSIIANNIAASYGKKQPGIILINNLVLKNARNVFRNVDNLDFELAPDSPAKHGASALFLPSTDIKGRERPKNDKGDIGAFQTPD
ncbi:MAG: right-handed parallel beta-helix repeat-containing protein [Rhodobacteraceae bacterium]|nr:right-handed parallel beta-helix repeat-containing protein [Paracoccaceae bacterium]